MDERWTAVAAHLGARAHAGPAGTLIVPLGGADVRLAAVSVGGAPWLDARLALHPAAEVPAASALAHNFDVAIGALAIEDAQVVIRQTLPLAAAAPAVVDAILDTFAAAAAEARTLNR